MKPVANDKSSTVSVIAAKPLVGVTAADRFRQRKTSRLNKLAALMSLFFILAFGGFATFGGAVSSQGIAQAAGLVPDELSCLGASTNPPSPETVSSTDGSFPRIDPASGKINNSIIDSKVANMVPQDNVNPAEKYTLFDTFGTAGATWTRFVPQAQSKNFNKCGITGIMESGYNAMANFIFSFTKFLTGVTISIYQWALSGSITGLLAGPISCIIGAEADSKNILGQSTVCGAGLFRTVFMPFFQPLIMMGALYMAYVGLMKKKTTEAWQAAAWMVGVGILVIVVSTFPLTILATMEATVNNFSNAATSAFTSNVTSDEGDDICYTNMPKGKNADGNQQEGFGYDDPQSSKVNSWINGTAMGLGSTRQQQRMASCSIYKALVFVPWAQGQFGVPLSYPLPADGKIIVEGKMDDPKDTKKLSEIKGDENYANRWTKMGLRTAHIDATAIWFGEEGKDPKKAFERDQNRFLAVAERSLPASEMATWGRAWMGDYSSQRVGTALLSLLGAACVSILVVGLSFMTIILSLTMLVMFAFTPFFLLLGTYPGNFGRNVARRFGGNLLNIIIKRILLGAILGFTVYLYSIIFELDTPWLFQMGLIIALTIAMMKLRYPILDTFNVVNVNSDKGRAQASANASLNRNLTGGGGSGNPGAGSINKLLGSQWMGAGRTPTGSDLRKGAADLGNRFLNRGAKPTSPRLNAGTDAEGNPLPGTPGFSPTGGDGSGTNLGAVGAGDEGATGEDQGQRSAFGDEEMYGVDPTRKAKTFGAAGGGVLGALGAKTVDNKTVPSKKARVVGAAHKIASGASKVGGGTKRSAAALSRGDYFGAVAPAAGATAAGLRKAGSRVGNAQMFAPARNKMDKFGQTRVGRAAGAVTRYSVGESKKNTKEFAGHFAKAFAKSPTKDPASVLALAGVAAARTAVTATGRNTKMAAGATARGVSNYAASKRPKTDNSQRVAMVNQSLLETRAKARQASGVGVVPSANKAGGNLNKLDQGSNSPRPQAYAAAGAGKNPKAAMPFTPGGQVDPNVRSTAKGSGYDKSANVGGLESNSPRPQSYKASKDDVNTADGGKGNVAKAFTGGKEQNVSVPSAKVGVAPAIKDAAKAAVSGKESNVRPGGMGSNPVPSKPSTAAPTPQDSTARVREAAKNAKPVEKQRSVTWPERSAKPIVQPAANQGATPLQRPSNVAKDKVTPAKTAQPRVVAPKSQVGSNSNSKTPLAKPVSNFDKLNKPKPKPKP